jgi:protein import protein ZIM17
VISDHLNIFGDKHMTIEDLMRERGQLVKKGTLSEDGDLEFWEDGSMTKRTDRTGKEEGEKGI